jgi:hypothetical protein
VLFIKLVFSLSHCIKSLKIFTVNVFVATIIFGRHECQEKNVCYGFCGVSNFHACRLQAYLTFTCSCHYSVVLLDIFVLSMMYEPLVNVQLQHFL